MRIRVGDEIVVESERASRSPRRGTVEEILSVEPPRFAVRWTDGHTSIFTPNAGVAQVVGRRRGRGAVRTERRKGGGMSQHTLPERRRSQQTERFDPLSEFEQVTERMQRLLDRTFGGVWGSRMGGEAAAGAWTPAADIEEQDDGYVVEVEVPGVKPDEVSIELIGNELSITGETRQEERKGTVRRQMRRFGRFEYRLTLPDQVDPEKVDAQLRDGVLTVRVPKTERAQRRQIQVKSASSTGGTQQSSSAS